MDTAITGLDQGALSAVARVARIDRGWSTAYRSMDEARGAAPPLRVRNIGADVAVGDWILPDADGERVAEVLPRKSA